VHRDLKLANILLHFPGRKDVALADLDENIFDENEFLVKIGDLGFAREA
jgi:serine/threonine protein kinase